MSDARLVSLSVGGLARRVIRGDLDSTTVSLCVASSESRHIALPIVTLLEQSHHLGRMHRHNNSSMLAHTQKTAANDMRLTTFWISSTNCTALYMGREAFSSFTTSTTVREARLDGWDIGWPFVIFRSLFQLNWDVDTQIAKQARIDIQILHLMNSTFSYPYGLGSLGWSRASEESRLLQASSGLKSGFLSMCKTAMTEASMPAHLLRQRSSGHIHSPARALGNWERSQRSEHMLAFRNPYSTIYAQIDA